MTETSTALAALLEGHEERHVGFVVASTFEDAAVLTADRWKRNVGGIPATCLLFASAYSGEEFTRADAADRQVLLLRVTGPKDMPLDADRSRAIIEHFQRKRESGRANAQDGIDTITHSMLQWHCMECNILGTFYADDEGRLRFGVDVEDFHVTSGLRVFKPAPKALETAVNHVDPDRLAAARADARKAGFQDIIEPIEIARVRYTSTDRMAKGSRDSEVPVRISPLDMIPRRTAIFGMTRTGKSNTVKTIISMTQMAACRSKVPIGQLIFDIAGEYANANGQDDGSSIADVFADNVVRYRGVTTHGFRDLRDNFYESLGDGLSFAQSLVRNAVGRTTTSQDMLSFLEMNLDQPHKDDHQEYNHWLRRRALYLALLKKANLDEGTPETPGEEIHVKFKMGEEPLRQLGAIYADWKGIVADTNAKAAAALLLALGDPKNGLTLDQAVKFFETVRKLEAMNRENEKTNNEQMRKRADNRIEQKPAYDSPIWFAPEETGLANLIAGESSAGGGIRGAKFIGDTIRNYHSPKGNASIADEIYSELSKGRIVILDLSVGIESVRIKRAETIAHKVFEKSFTAFTSGAVPPKIVLFVEEAHNLIGKDCDPDDTWPRIAKEGAKAGIALIYATQEPSSINGFIRANTENVFVTHLNNTDEARSMGRYYDFADFERSIRRSQDVGFARIKTLSSAFVLPVQINKFKPDEMKKLYNAEARPDRFEPVKDGKPVGDAAKAITAFAPSAPRAPGPRAGTRLQPAPTPVEEV